MYWFKSIRSVTREMHNKTLTYNLKEVVSKQSKGQHKSYNAHLQCCYNIKSEPQSSIIQKQRKMKLEEIHIALLLPCQSFKQRCCVIYWCSEHESEMTLRYYHIKLYCSSISVKVAELKPFLFDEDSCGSQLECSWQTQAVSCLPSIHGSGGWHKWKVTSITNTGVKIK